MKKSALYFSGIIFFIVSVVHIARFSLKISIIVGTHSIPIVWSLWAANLFALFAMWMFLAAIKR